MSDYPQSKRLLTMFASATKSGGTYYSTTHKGDEPIVIQPGQRITLVKSTKVASNGSEIWSLLADEAGTRDENRVYENTNTHDHKPAPRSSSSFDRRLDDEIPF